LKERTNQETSAEDDGQTIRKTIVEYATNDKGQKIQLVKKVKQYKTQVRINKRVEERKKTWKKFGECKNEPPGPEKGITSIGDAVFLESSNKSKQSDAKKPKDQLINIICRHCGKTGDHWTLKCPYKDKLDLPRNLGTDGRDPRDTGSGPDKYVPPGMRGERRDEGATIRVTNLSEDTKESDLSELFRVFGPISRIYLAKDKNTGLSKGFAFINFVYREDAARAIEKLSRFGYDHLILHVEWAKPSNK